MKSSPAAFLALLVALLLMDLLAVYTFTTGFFLTRVELNQSSTCANRPSLDPGNSQATTINNGSAERFCWLQQKPRFKRVVLLVIDALKYEFAEWREDLDLPQERPFGRDSSFDFASTLLS